MGAVRKTARFEHPTPSKARFRALVEIAGWDQRRAAQHVNVPQSIAAKWLRQASDRRTGKTRPGRPKIITEA